MAIEVTCPFCGFKKDNEYAIQLHIEEHHTEDSPFTILNAAPDLPSSRNTTAQIAPPPAGNGWTKCTRTACGEFVSVADIQEHLDLHEAIDASEEDAETAGYEGHRVARRSRGITSIHKSNVDVRDAGCDDSSGDDLSGGRSSRYISSTQQRNKWEGRSNGSTSTPSTPSQQSGSNPRRPLLDYLTGNLTHEQQLLPPRPPRRIEQPRQPGRLGIKELGPHAFEERMPAEVRRKLITEALPRDTNRIARDGRIVKDSVIDNETAGLIPLLANLCARSRTAETAYFCNRSVRHIHKIHCEGNFCGYWNLQMMLTFLMDNAKKSGLVPNVLDIQDIIERAWDNGICSYSRIETGGIRGTRKWIGTHDALAFFSQEGVSVQALSFKDEDANQPAILSLLDHVEAYFISGLEGAETRGSSHITELPPIYFQRSGHSMTIVGLERKNDGHRNLIIFDPSFGTARAMDAKLKGKRTQVDGHTLLKPYRRSDESLRRWDEFEILIPQPKSSPDPSG